VGLVVDGKVVVVDPTAARSDFAALSQRLTAGPRPAELAGKRPTQLVCFDMLGAGRADVYRQTRLAA
jgi:ATP-dependent DNA ligase